MSDTKYENRSVLVVDDDAPTLRAFSRMLLHWFGTVYTAENGFEALDLLNEKKVDIVLSDIEMPKMNGLELLAKIKTHYPETGVVVITAYEDYASKAELADAVLLKPLRKESLQEAIASAMQA